MAKNGWYDGIVGQLNRKYGEKDWRWERNQMVWWLNAKDDESERIKEAIRNTSLILKEVIEENDGETK